MAEHGASAFSLTSPPLLSLQCSITEGQGLETRIHMPLGCIVLGAILRHLATWGLPPSSFMLACGMSSCEALWVTQKSPLD